MSKYQPKESVTPDELLAMLDAAHAEISAVNHGKRWQMTVPVQHDDSDVVICDALRHARRFILARLSELSQETNNG